METPLELINETPTGNNESIIVPTLKSKRRRELPSTVSISYFKKGQRRSILVDTYSLANFSDNLLLLLESATLQNTKVFKIEEDSTLSTFSGIYNDIDEEVTVHDIVFPQKEEYGEMIKKFIYHCNCNTPIPQVVTDILGSANQAANYISYYHLLKDYGKHGSCHITSFIECFSRSSNFGSMSIEDCLKLYRFSMGVPYSYHGCVNHELTNLLKAVAKMNFKLVHLLSTSHEGWMTEAMFVSLPEAEQHSLILWPHLVIARSPGFKHLKFINNNNPIYQKTLGVTNSEDVKKGVNPICGVVEILSEYDLFVNNKPNTVGTYTLNKQRIVKSMRLTPHSSPNITFLEKTFSLEKSGIYADEHKFTVKITGTIEKSFDLSGGIVHVLSARIEMLGNVTPAFAPFRTPAFMAGFYFQSEGHVKDKGMIDSVHVQMTEASATPFIATTTAINVKSLAENTYTPRPEEYYGSLHKSPKYGILVETTGRMVLFRDLAAVNIVAYAQIVK